MNVISDPWEHMILDNFYEQLLFDEMRIELENFASQLRDHEQKVTLKTYNSDFKDMFPKAYRCINSRPIDESYLQFFKRHRPYTKAATYSEVNMLFGEYDYPIHDEATQKVLSVVTYVSPLNAIGTILYDRDKNFSKEVEWKPNSTFIFPAETNLTWHSYKSTTDTTRITINSFVVDESFLSSR